MQHNEHGPQKSFKVIYLFYEPYDITFIVER